VCLGNRADPVCANCDGDVWRALLGRVADPFTLMEFFTSCTCWQLLLSFACGILGILGGMSLSGNKSSSRGTLIAASILSASNLPVGIALSLYTLCMLMPARRAES